MIAIKKGNEVVGFLRTDNEGDFVTFIRSSVEVPPSRDRAYYSEAFGCVRVVNSNWAIVAEFYTYKIY